jgi:hypothetical protein
MGNSDIIIKTTTMINKSQKVQVSRISDKIHGSGEFHPKLGVEAEEVGSGQA